MTTSIRSPVAAACRLSQTAGMNFVFPFIFAAIGVSVLVLLWHVLGPASRRQRAIRGLLDAADALETRLRAAREEIEAIAGDQQDPVRGAMQEILRQRLWLQDHADDASVEHLQTIRDSLEAARIRLEGQLERVDTARSSGI